MSGVTAREYEARLRLGGEPLLGPNFYWKIRRGPYWERTTGCLHAFRIIRRDRLQLYSLCGRAERDTTTSLSAMEGRAPIPPPCRVCLKVLERQDALR